MSINRLKMNDASTVSAGGRSVFNLPIGYTYHQFQLMMGGTTFDKSHIDAMRLRIDGEIVQELGSGTMREAINKFNRKNDASDGVLVVDFERPGVHDPLSRLKTIIGTGFVHNGKQSQVKQSNELSTLQLEVDIAAGAVAPTLELYAMVSAKQPLGVVRRIVKNTYTIPSGDFQITDLPRGGLKHAALDALYIKHANLTDVEIKVNNNVEQQLDIAGNEHDQKDGARTPQAGYLIWDSTQQGFGNQELSLANAQDFRLELKASAGDTIEVYAVYHGAKGR